MTDWILWFAAAGTLVILEIFTGTFYLLMIAIGLGAGGLLALTGADRPAQLIAAALIGMAATIFLRKSRLGRQEKTDAARDPNVNLDIGQTIHIENWNVQEEGHAAHATARVMYRGAMWDAELAHGSRAQPGPYVIREIRGSRLIVANIGQHH